MNETTVINPNEDLVSKTTVCMEQIDPPLDETLESNVPEVTADELPTDTLAEACEEACEEICEETVTDTPALPSTEELHAELTRLRTELEETKALHARMATELGEFHALFPEVNVSGLPESIWEQVKSGIPLAASYALYEKKCTLHREHAAKINMQNAKKTPGAAGKNTPAEYFSPDEVRAMSQSEVRSNYHKILESMKKWNS